MNELDFKVLKEIARKQYNDANCKYDNNEYFLHIDMVINCIEKHENVFKLYNDYTTTRIAILFHDSIEDANQSYNDIFRIAGKDVADITLAVTDVPADNRLMKHLLTMHKTVKDYRAIILKMCDILANATYSKANGSSMYNKYVAEYAYRKPIFQLALTWYKEYLNQDELDVLWNELNMVHKKKCGCYFIKL